MSLAPLFAPDYATLMKSLRLTSGLPTSGDAIQIVDDAILGVRLKFINRLGLLLVNSIVSTTYTDTPSTNAEYLRTLASVLEAKWVRAELLLTLPSAWMDSSGDIWRRWNQEAPFREMRESELLAMRNALLTEIDAGLEILAGEDEIGSDSSINTWDGAPDSGTPSIGDSLGKFPWWNDSTLLSLDTNW